MIGRGEKVKIERSHWTDLIMDSVGDDPDRAEEFYTQYKLNIRLMVIEGTIAIAIVMLFMLAMVSSVVLLGVEAYRDADLGEIAFEMMLVISGTMVGLLIAAQYGDLLMKLKKRAENTKYYAGRIEKKEGDDQCR